MTGRRRSGHFVRSAAHGGDPRACADAEADTHLWRRAALELLLYK